MISKAVQELLKNLEYTVEFGFINGSFFRDVSKVRATLTSQESTTLLNSLLSAKNNLGDDYGYGREKTATFIKLISLIVDMLDQSTATLTSQEYTALLYGLLECLHWDYYKNNRKKIFTIIVNLLDRGADVQQKTPFLDVSENNLIQLFLEKGADPNQRDSDQKMSLMNSNLGPAGLKLLLQSGADPNAQDKDGNSPLFFHSEKPTNLRLLLASGADVNHRNQEGITALMQYASCTDEFHQKSIEKSIALLLQQGADPNMADYKGRTALMHLNLKWQNTWNLDMSSAFKAMVEAGADIHQRTPDGKTLLQHYLASHYKGKHSCEYNCAIALLNLNGANQQINIPDDLGQHPLNYLALNYTDEDFKSNWKPNQPAALIRTLLKNGADPNFADKNGETPLMFWASQTTLRLSKQVVTLMLDAGADANRTDSQGRTALMHAAKNNNVATVRALLPQTAIPNARCQQGYSCLEYALTHPDWPQNGVIPALIHGGVHINSPNGSTANSLNLLGKVIATGDCDYAVELLQQGAKINQSTLQTLQIKAQELTDKARLSQIMTPMEESFIALARMQPELLLSALDCGDTGITDQLRQLVEIVTSESQDSALFQKLLSPWPPQFAQRKPLVVDNLTQNQPTPSVNFRQDESNGFASYEFVLESWVNSNKDKTDESGECIKKVLKSRSYSVVARNHQGDINMLLLAKTEALARLWNETVSAEIKYNCYTYYDGPEHAFVSDGVTPFKWEVGRHYSDSDIDLDALKYIVWRCGVEVIPGMLRISKLAPDLLCRVLWPLVDVRIVPLMVSQRDQVDLARQWLLRHPSVAAHGLIPVAVGPPGTLRSEYESLLRWLASHGHGQVIRDVAATYGTQVSEAVAQILSVDRISDFHRQKLRNMPLWVLNGQYHLPVEKATGAPLSGVYLQRLFEMMSLSTYNDVYPPLAELLDLFDHQSLAEFGWSVFQVWNEADTVESINKHRWMLNCLGYLADVSIASRLVDAIRTLSTTYARKSLEIDVALRVLALIGDEVAIRALYEFQNSKDSHKSLKKQATYLLDDIALTRNVSVEELQDRLVPTFDLDQPGTLQLNLGSRVFTIGISEKLVPSLYDNHGNRLKSSPDVCRDDDPALVKVATGHWRNLKESLEKMAATQLPRLEQAMLNKRRWSQDDFHRYLAGHPLLRFVVRSLIWCAVWEDQPECYFRINDKGDFIDVADCPVTVPAAAQIFLPHPIYMGHFVDLWKDSLVRNHIKQPFAQITRQVYRIEEDLHQDLFGIQGTKAPSQWFRGLKASGWIPIPSEEGYIWNYNKKLSSGTACINYDLSAYINYAGEETMFDVEKDEDKTLDIDLPDNLTSINFSEIVREIKDLLH